MVKYYLITFKFSFITNYIEGKIYIVETINLNNKIGRELPSLSLSACCKTIVEKIEFEDVKT